MNKYNQRIYRIARSLSLSLSRDIDSSPAIIDLF